MLCHGLFACKDNASYLYAGFSVAISAAYSSMCAVNSNAIASDPWLSVVIGLAAILFGQSVKACLIYHFKLSINFYLIYTIFRWTRSLHGADISSGRRHGWRDWPTQNQEPWVVISSGVFWMFLDSFLQSPAWHGWRVHLSFSTPIFFALNGWVISLMLSDNVTLVVFV